MKIKSSEKNIKTSVKIKRLPAKRREKNEDDKTITFKLDRPRYIKLKTYGLHADKSNQIIMLEALDAYLAKHIGDKNHA